MSDHDSTEDPRGRIARRIFPDGDDPDPRFTLANERTFLSWIRTALAFIGGGIAVEAFTSEIFSTGLRATLSIVLMVIGFVLASGAAFRWHRIESAMRRKTSLPLPLIIPIVSLASALGPTCWCWCSRVSCDPSSRTRAPQTADTQVPAAAGPAAQAAAAP